jgi:hypothetical protein
LPHVLRHLQRQHPRRIVHRTACSQWNDHSDGFLRIGRLRTANGSDAQQSRQRQGAKGGYFFDAYFSPILSPVADLRALGYTYMPPN